jgi:hypothetical protein
MAGPIQVPDCPGRGAWAQAAMTRSKALSMRISQRPSCTKRCSVRRSERCSRKRSGASTMRGSGLHHRMGSPALNHGNRPEP